MKTDAGRGLAAVLDGLFDDDIRDIEAEATTRGYREGRLAAWQELAQWATEQSDIADRVLTELDGPLPTADDVLGILSPDRLAATSPIKGDRGDRP